MEVLMRTNIDIDEKLIAEVMRNSGVPTKKAVVDAALKLMLRVQGQSSIRRHRGKVKWEGDLEESRLGRNTN
jgi:Arc/MetJ family transcription regulator